MLTGNSIETLMRTPRLMIVMAATFIACYAQQPASLDSKITPILTRMTSKNVATRNTALDELLTVISEGRQLGYDPLYGDVLAAFLKRHPEQENRVKLGFIGLLQMGNEAFINDEAPPMTYTENDSEHYAEAIGIVASLDDERTIPALVGAMTTGGMAAGGLLKYGLKVLGPVLRELDNPNPLIRSSAVSVAIAILKRNNDPASHAQIRRLIQAAINDMEFLVRSSALRAIDDLAKTEQRRFTPDLQRMTKEDPFSTTDGRYVLRDRSQQMLDKITNQN
jgi:hypothetical protein